MSVICVSYFDKINRDRKSDFITNSGSPMATTYDYKIVDGKKSLHQQEQDPADTAEYRQPSSWGK